MPVLLHLTSLDVVEPFILDITFSDGETRMVDVRPLLRGPEALRSLESINVARSG